jgi:hypothetical protein
MQGMDPIIRSTIKSAIGEEEEDGGTFYHFSIIRSTTKSAVNCWLNCEGSCAALASSQSSFDVCV